MLYTINKKHIEKIDHTNIIQVISYIFKDYIDIIEYYKKFILALNWNIDLVNLFVEEIKTIHDLIISKEQKLTNEEEEIIVEKIRFNLRESFKEINSSATKIFIKKREEEEKELYINSILEII